MNPFQERKGVMKAIHRLAHAKEPAAKIRRDKEPVECRACGETAMREEWRDNLYICPHCGNHRGMTAALRIRITADSGSFREFGRSIRGGNPLGFPGYTEKIQGMRDKTNLNDAVVTGTAKIHGRRTVLVVMDNRFMMAAWAWRWEKKSPAPLNMPRRKNCRSSCSPLRAALGCKKA